MRRVLVTLALVLMVGAAAACEADSAPPAAPSPSAAAMPPGTTGPPRPETLAVCTEAVMISRTGAATYSATLDEMWVRARLHGDQAAMDAKFTQVDEALRVAVASWANRLTALAAQDVDPPVKTALLNSAHTVEKMNDPTYPASLGEARMTLERLDRAIATACPA